MKHTPIFRGLTLLEVVVSVSIFTVIMVVVVTSVLFFYRANSSSLEQSYQIDSARKGIEFMVRDLREASYGENGSYPLASIASTSITFFSDSDQDQDVERISYALSGTTLSRGVLNPSGVPLVYAGGAATSSVSEYVRNFEENRAMFQYYDKEGAEITNYANIAAVRFVSVHLIVNILPLRAPEEFTLRSSATLRNLRND